MSKMKIDPRVKNIVNAFKAHGIDLDEELTQCSFSYDPDLAEAMFRDCLDEWSEEGGDKK